MSVLHNFEGLVRPRFIETGTYEGHTLENASKVFDECLSVEQNEVLFKRSSERLAGMQNVRIFKGHSGKILREIIDPKIATTFWLDAHYFSSANTLCSEGGECPLLAEVTAIASFEWDTPPIILIDDAFMFDDTLKPPGAFHPEPFWRSNDCDYTIYHKAQWPRITEIDALLPKHTRVLDSRDESIFKYEVAP